MTVTFQTQRGKPTQILFWGLIITLAAQFSAHAFFVFQPTGVGASVLVMIYFAILASQAVGLILLLLRWRAGLILYLTAYLLFLLPFGLNPLFFLFKPHSSIFSTTTVLGYGLLITTGVLSLLVDKKVPLKHLLRRTETVAEAQDGDRYSYKKMIVTVLLFTLVVLLFFLIRYLTGPALQQSK